MSSRGSSLAPILGGLAVIAAMTLGACGRGDDDAAGGHGGRGHPGMGKGMGGGGTRATPVRVVEVSSGAIDSRSTYVAETRPRADVRLSAEVAGIVESVHADLGDVVEKGQLLARIRGRTFGQAVREAEASVAQAEAAVLRASTDLELAEKEQERARRLHERGALTRAELDGIEGRHSAASAALALARADVQARVARLERARIDMANTRVVAPFSGVIAERAVDPGALISPGTAVFRLVDSASVIVRFAVPEADVTRLVVGQGVEVAFDAAGIAPAMGTVDRISPVLDPQTRTTPVEVLIEAGDRIRPGMFARVTATLATRDDVPLLPMPALVRRQLEDDTEAREGVFVVSGDRARFREIGIGLRSRAAVEIVDGLEVGDSIVIAGHSELRDGAAIRVVNGEDAGVSARKGAGVGKMGKAREDS